MTDSLAYLFEQTSKNACDEMDIELDKAPAIGNSFLDVHLIDKKDNSCGAVIEQGSFKETDKDLQFVEVDCEPQGTPEFPYNWMHAPESGRESFRLKVKSRSLLLVFKDTASIDFGKADIYVDGTYILTADPQAVGWTHCNAVILYQEEISKEHNIEIKMSDDSFDKYFTILGFGYN
jgi:hypothetical protein